MSKFQQAVPGQGGGPRNTNPQSRYSFSGSNPFGEPAAAPRLQFGEHGELTHETIKQAGLTGEEKKRAIEMLKVQEAYLKIYECLDYPNDPDGHVVDLSGIHFTQPKVAIAWTLALAGCRFSGRKYIKQRHIDAGGVYSDAHYWVDARLSDNAADDLRPEHSSYDASLPPDTRRLAAQRDGDPGQEHPPLWNTAPVVTEEFVPRDPSVTQRIPQHTDTMSSA
jgi:hypothetical protein